MGGLGGKRGGRGEVGGEGRIKYEGGGERVRDREREGESVEFFNHLFSQITE